MLHEITNVGRPCCPQSPREREQEELHKRHMTKARPLPAFYKDRSAKGGSPARAEQVGLRSNAPCKLDAL